MNNLLSYFCFQLDGSTATSLFGCKLESGVTLWNDTYRWITSTQYVPVQSVPSSIIFNQSQMYVAECICWTAFWSIKMLSAATKSLISWTSIPQLYYFCENLLLDTHDMLILICFWSVLLEGYLLVQLICFVVVFLFQHLNLFLWGKLSLLRICYECCWYSKIVVWSLASTQ